MGDAEAILIASATAVVNGATVANGANGNVAPAEPRRVAIWLENAFAATGPLQWRQTLDGVVVGIYNLARDSGPLYLTYFNAGPSIWAAWDCFNSSGSSQVCNTLSLIATEAAWHEFFRRYRWE